MSRIVKSRATVSAAHIPGMVLPQESVAPPAPQVIKRGFSAQNRFDLSTDFRLVGPRDPYVEELNRLKVEIEQARAELRYVRANGDDSFVSDDFEEDDDSAGGSQQATASIERELAAARHEAQRMGAEAAKAAAELEQRAYATLREAEEKAKLIEAQAFSEALQLKQQSQNEGYLEGFNKGFDEAQEEFRRENEPRAELLADLIENLSEYEQERLRKNESELVALALGIASKVIGQEIRTEPAAIVKMLTDTVMQNHSEEYIRITIAEDLFPLNVKASDKLKKTLIDMGANVSVFVESSAPAGTIQVETPKGITDMGIDTQLENISAILGTP